MNTYEYPHSGLESERPVTRRPAGRRPSAPQRRDAGSPGGQPQSGGCAEEKSLQPRDCPDMLARSCPRSKLSNTKVSCTPQKDAYESQKDPYNTLRQVVANAVGMLDNTIAELTRGRRAACSGGTTAWPTLGDVTACWLKYKLGVDIDNPSVWTAESSVNKSVAEVIRRLVGPRNLLARNAVEYLCKKDCAGVPGPHAWVKATDASGKCLSGTPERKIHLCPFFWGWWHAPYREQTLIQMAARLTHCAQEARGDTAVAASIGSPTCLAQFVAATNGKKLDRTEGPCGWVNGVKPKGIRDRCGAELGPDTDWHPSGPKARGKAGSELEFGTEPSWESELQFDVAQSSPITVRELANQLANLVFEARNPTLKGKKLKPGTQSANDWLNILNQKILPALHRHSVEWTVSQLIFFARNPKVRGRFKQLPADQQRKFSKEFDAISAAEVRPLLSLQIAQGPANSRTIYVADTDAFQTLPALTRTAAGDELAREFEFIGVAEPNAPARVIILEPRRYPEKYNHSDAVIAVTGTLPNVYVNQGFHQQTKNINRSIRGAGGRLSVDETTRVTAVPERIGLAKMSKEVTNIPGIGWAAITRMIAAVSLKEVVSFLNEEIIPGNQPRLAADARKWTEGQQQLVGLALGRAMAHEVRHLYVADPLHAAAGLGVTAPRLFGAGNTDFSNADKTSILAALRNLARQQGTVTVIPTYNNGDDRNGDFPF